MAVVEFIVSQPMEYDPTSKDSVFGFINIDKLNATHDFPQIFWQNFLPWKEANQYAFSRYYDSNKSLKTVTREAVHIGMYADWLEHNNLDWLHFPRTKRERCLYKFRGFLVDSRDAGLLAASTVSQVMNALIRFYRWVSDEGLIDKNYNLWADNATRLRFFDKEGFERTLVRKTTDLAIHNRKRGHEAPEGGLFPLIIAQVKVLMSYLKSQSNYEFYLLHKTSLLTGCRFETITTLTIDALRNSYRISGMDKCFHIRVGPGTNVKTKFDVIGSIPFPDFLVDELIAHYESLDSILRRSHCIAEHHKNIFLTNRGNLYTLQSFSTLMKRLRDELAKKGHSEFQRFKFHQLRATFASMLMRSALASKGMSKANAIEYVKDTLLQKDTRTAWKYVKFIEQSPVLDEYHELLWQLFTNEKSSTEEIVGKLSGRHDG
jgi:integrase